MMRFEKDIVLVINNDIYQELKECVKKARPNEACGLIFGMINQIENPGKSEDYLYQYSAKKFECIESDRKSPVAFLINEEEKLDNMCKTAKFEHDLNLISIFHSHPAGNHPSSTDLKNMEHLDFFKSFRRLIWSIMDARKNKMKAFMYLNREFIQVDITFILNGE